MLKGEEKEEEDEGEFSTRKSSLWNRHLHWPGRVSMHEMQCHGQIRHLSSDVQ